MAYTAIADIIPSRPLAAAISAKFPDNLVIGAAASGVVKVNDRFPLGTKGTEFQMPFWNKIAPLAPLTEGVAMTPSKITMGTEYAVVQRAGGAYEVLDTAQLTSISDPMTEISNQYARRVAEYLDTALVTSALKTPNVYDATAVGDGKMSASVLNNGLATMGDNRQNLLNGGVIIMHSKPYFDLLENGQITTANAGGVLFTGEVGRLMGLPILLSDRLPTGTIAGPPVKTTYQTLVIAPGALSLFFQRNAQVEYDRDILLQADVMAVTLHFASHLDGYDDKTNTVVATSNKLVGVVAIKTL